MNHRKWMTHALALASEALTAGEFPVGCVIVSDETVVAAGRRMQSKGNTPSELDHAEIIALRNLESIRYPTDKRSDLWLYSTLEPCLMCMGAILISGIRRIVYAYEDVMGGAGHLPWSVMRPLYADADLTILPDVLRSESLALFEAFFSNPDVTYCKDTALARHALSGGSGRPAYGK